MHWFAMILLALTVAGAPRPAHAGPASDNLLELAGRGGPSVGLGFGVPRLQWQSIAPLPALAGSTAADTPTSAELAYAASVDETVEEGGKRPEPPASLDWLDGFGNPGEELADGGETGGALQSGPDVASGEVVDEEREMARHKR